MRNNNNSFTGGVSRGPQQRRFNPRTGASPVGGDGKFARKVKKVILDEVEVKTFDVASNYANVSAACNVSNLTQITTGTGPSQRTGDTVKLKHIELRVAGYQNNTTSVQYPNIVRVVVFRWGTYTNVSVPTGTSVFQVAAIGSIGSSICSPYAEATQRSGQVQVLHDSYHMTSLNSNSFAFKFEMALDSEITYAAGGTDGKDGLFICLQSDDAGVVSPCPSVAFYSRVSYVD
jgi:hypothetical protein